MCLWNKHHIGGCILKVGQLRQNLIRKSHSLQMPLALRHPQPWEEPPGAMHWLLLYSAFWTLPAPTGFLSSTAGGKTALIECHTLHWIQQTWAIPGTALVAHAHWLPVPTSSSAMQLRSQLCSRDSAISALTPDCPHWPLRPFIHLLIETC